VINNYLDATSRRWQSPIFLPATPPERGSRRRLTAYEIGWVSLDNG
jgi:hypothetical protein